MKKMIVTLLAVFCMLSVFAGCSSSEQPKEVDMKALADSLANEVTYSDTLDEISAETAIGVYGFDKDSIEEIIAYVSTGATAEEFVIVKAKDADGAKAAETVMKDRLTYLEEGFQDYGPAEVPKIKNAVVKTNGVYAVLSIADDNKQTGELIGKYF